MPFWKPAHRISSFNKSVLIALRERVGDDGIDRLESLQSEHRFVPTEIIKITKHAGPLFFIALSQLVHQLGTTLLFDMKFGDAEDAIRIGNKIHPEGRTGDSLLIFLLAETGQISEALELGNDFSSSDYQGKLEAAAELAGAEYSADDDHVLAIVDGIAAHAQSRTFMPAISELARLARAGDFRRNDVGRLARAIISEVSRLSTQFLLRVQATTKTEYTRGDAHAESLGHAYAWLTFNLRLYATCLVSEYVFSFEGLSEEMVRGLVEVIAPYPKIFEKIHSKDGPGDLMAGLERDDVPGMAEVMLVKTRYIFQKHGVEFGSEMLKSTISDLSAYTGGVFQVIDEFLPSSSD